MTAEKSTISGELKKPNTLFSPAHRRSLGHSLGHCPLLCQKQSLVLPLAKKGAQANPAQLLLPSEAAGIPRELSLPLSTVTVGAGSRKWHCDMSWGWTFGAATLRRAYRTLLYQTRNTEYVRSFSRISSSVILDFFRCRSVFLYKVFVFEFSGWGVVASLAGAGAAAGSITERV